MIMHNKNKERYEALKKEWLYKSKPVPSYELYIKSLQKQDKTEASNFWSEQLRDIETPTSLGFNIASINIHKPIKIGYEVYTWSEEFTHICDQFVKWKGVTLNVLAKLAWGVVLSKYSNNDNVILGTIVSNYSAKSIQTEKMIDLFSNLLPIRFTLDENKSARDHLLDMHTKIQLSNQYSYLSLNEIQSQSKIPKELPLFYSLFIFGNHPIGSEIKDWEEVSLGVKGFYVYEKINYPITIYMFLGKQLTIKVAYDTECFNLESICYLVKHIKNVMEWIVNHSEERLGNVDLLDAEERKKILIDWSGTSPLGLSKETIHQLFEKQVKRVPNNVAIVYGKEEITYDELNKRANQLARFLIKQKNANNLGQVVALYMDRSIQMLESILAIWKCKMAYSLVDPKLPAERIKSMIKLINPLFVLTKNKFVQNLREIGINNSIINFDEISKSLLRELDHNLDLQYSNNELSYVFFTSGSTGKLKGALLEHAGVLNHLVSKLKDIGASEDTVIAQTANQNFNIFNWQAFGALTLGGRTVIYSDDIVINSLEFVHKLVYDKINILQITPSYLSVLLDALVVQGKTQKLEWLKMLLITGEEVIPYVINRWFKYYPNIFILNSYGCAEVSDDSLHYVIRESFNITQKIPIGKPILNTVSYIVKGDEQNGWKMCAVGEIGEIWLSGIGVGKGYINDEEETNKRYVADPFCIGRRAFKTGDLGRWLINGNIEYLGRTDFQVKVRGGRVELGEIESILNQYESISQCVVLASKSEDRVVLTAYYALKPSFDRKHKHTSSANLRQYLSKYLAAHMIPSFFICIDVLPLTPSGKIDRRALLSNVTSDMAFEEDYIAPRNDIERILTKIWMGLLKSKRIGVRDNFFSLGGDSIMSIQVVSRAREAGLNIKPRQVFNFPTIEELAKEAKKVSKRIEIEIEQGLVEGEAILTPIQRWFFSQRVIKFNHFNQAYLFKLQEPLEKKLVIQIFRKLIEQHDIFRVRYSQDKKNKHWVQKFLQEQDIFTIEVEEICLNKFSEEEIEWVIENNNTKIQERLNIDKGPVIRVGLYVGHKDGYQRLFIAIHHLVIDGVSWRIILEDFERIYNQLKFGEKIKLPPKTSSYKAWGDALDTYTKDKRLNLEWDYWLSVGKEASLLPTDYKERAGISKKGKVGNYIISLSEEETNLLLNQVPLAYHTQINDILLSALVMSCWKWTGHTDLLLHLEGHGREDCIKEVDVSRTVGWFTSLFPVHLRMPSEYAFDQEKHLSEVIKDIKEQLKKIPNKGIGYGVLRYLSQDDRVKELIKNDKALISFNYLGQMEAGRSKGTLLQSAGESIGVCISEKNYFGVPIDMTGIISCNRFSLIFDYSEDFYNEKSMRSIAGMFKAQLQTIIWHCVKKVSLALR